MGVRKAPTPTHTTKYIMPHQSKVVKAAVTKMDPVSTDNSIAFNRCGHCGDKKPQCRKQKKCLKGLL